MDFMRSRWAGGSSGTVSFKRSRGDRWS
jgi:hypothetical protein